VRSCSQEGLDSTGKRGRRLVRGVSWRLNISPAGKPRTLDEWIKQRRLEGVCSQVLDPVVEQRAPTMAIEGWAAPSVAVVRFRHGVVEPDQGYAPSL